MSIAAALLTAALATVPLPRLGPPPAKACTAEELLQVGFAPADFKRLDELPRAYTHLAVIRSVGGCFVATIRYGGRNYWAPIPQTPGAMRVPAGDARPNALTPLGAL
jgi:hypothetical protein